MKRNLVWFGAVLVSSLGFAQSRLTIADYVLAMPKTMTRISFPQVSQLPLLIGDTKKSEIRRIKCGFVEKNLKVDYLAIEYCENGGLKSHLYAIWRSPNQPIVTIGSIYYYGWGSEKRFEIGRAHV